ncbi:50S ribosomal protein L11 methyltransferase [Paenibacillus polygoni]|uniref:Ribosomal protein L11 methyltransferase n=1 Tax=Paenibacillus polygoni TaxID=3050112 RepID=A0ABY8X0U3_9BACL|nr:50S ribosomal protein L11 methyltransferase [Paenibacillus polygoni]WIV18314.1 50S ribosomal protein L11 methyltransferase [Paenibacillus polygoni]
MIWNEITIHTTEEAVEMISNFLHEAGAGGVSIEESGTLNKKRSTEYGELYDQPLNDIPEGEAVIKGYFADTVNMTEVMNAIHPRIEELKEFNIDAGKADISVQQVDEDSWANAWKQYFKPLKVSDQLVIKPTWEEYVPASPAEKIIEIDPGMAFGTGAHPTTSLCLRALEQYLQGGEEIIDVGTGSGILAIGAVKLGAKHVLALDLDPVAVQSAEENSRLNGLEHDITVYESDLLSILDKQDNALGVSMPVDVVVANILAEVILLFIGDVYQGLKPGGLYIASGIWKNKEEIVEKALKEAGFDIIDIHREDDWLAFVSRK